MSSLFAIIQEETFNQWQMKIQDKILTYFNKINHVFLFLCSMVTGLPTIDRLWHTHQYQ